MKSRKFRLFLLLGSALLFSMFLVTDISANGDPYTKTFSDSEYSEESNEFKMGNFIHVEIYAPDLNKDVNKTEYCKFNATSGEDPSGIVLYAKETGNNTGIFREAFQISYSASQDGEKNQYGELLCDRDGDNVSILVDYNGDDVTDKTSNVSVIYDPMNNLTHDTWMFTNHLLSFVLTIIIGALIGLIPSRYLEPILGKFPILGDKYEDAIKLRRAGEKKFQKAVPLIWKWVISGILESMGMFIVKIILGIENIPLEYINTGLSIQYMIMLALASTAYGFAGYTIGFIIGSIKEMSQDFAPR